MTYGSLFSGIGGLDRGLDLAGWTCRWQVEIDPYCRRVLDRHWPEVPKHDDIHTFVPMDDVDCVVGGFPCQDISSAATIGRRRGLRGARSGLWGEFYRIVIGCRPAWVLVENSPQWQRWVPAVRADLARIGYASLSVVVSASAVGAPHARPRAFVIAHADRDGESLRAVDAEMARLSTLAGALRWPDPPDGVGVVDGIPDRMDRVRALGNATVPQVAAVIGQAMASVA